MRTQHLQQTCGLNGTIIKLNGGCSSQPCLPDEAPKNPDARGVK